MNPGYKRFATSDRANLERDRTKLIPHAVLPRFLAQHVCHGPGLGFFSAYLCIPVQDSMLERFGEVCFWSKKWRDQKFALVFFRSKPWCWALSWELWEDPVAINGAQGEKMKKNDKCSPKMTKPVSNYSCLLAIDQLIVHDFLCCQDFAKRISPVLPVHLTAGPHHRVGPLCLRLAAVQSLGRFFVWECGKFGRSGATDAQKKSLLLDHWDFTSVWSSSFFFFFCFLMFLFVSVLWFSST